MQLVFHPFILFGRFYLGNRKTCTPFRYSPVFSWEKSKSHACNTLELILWLSQSKDRLLPQSFPHSFTIAVGVEALGGIRGSLFSVLTSFHCVRDSNSSSFCCRTEGRGRARISAKIEERARALGDTSLDPFYKKKSLEGGISRGINAR